MHNPLKASRRKQKFVFFRHLKTYWRIRSKYLAVLKNVESRILENGQNSILEQREKLESYGFIKDTYFSRFLIWNVVPLLAFVLLLFGLYLTSRNPSTKIYAELNVSAVSFETEKDYLLESHESDSTTINVSNGLLTFTGNVSEQLPVNNTISVTIEPDNNSSITIKELSIPEKSLVSLYKPLSTDLKLIIRNKNDVKCNGTISFNSGKVSFDTNTKSYPLETNGKDVIPHLLGFYKDFTDYTNFEILVSKSVVYHMPRLYINKLVSFNENNATNERPISGVVSGFIKLLDTNDDVISLLPGDTLKMSFVNPPVKINLEADSKYIRLIFSAEVNQLFIGSSLQKEKNALNQMPIRLKTLYDKYPYLWAIVIAFLPFILPLIFRQRRAL